MSIARSMTWGRSGNDILRQLREQESWLTPELLTIKFRHQPVRHCTPGSIDDTSSIANREIPCASNRERSMKPPRLFFVARCDVSFAKSVEAERFEINKPQLPKFSLCTGESYPIAS